MKNLLISIALLTFSVIQGCTLQSPVDESFYQASENIVGGEKPTTPILEPLDYPTQKVLKWSASTDPDSSPANSEVTQYNIYYYLNTLPTGLARYANEYYWISSEQNQFSIEGYIFPSGTNYIGVTAFDGGRESEISNIISFKVE